MIPYGRQDITESDVAAVCEVLTSKFLTQGPAVPAFEASVSKKIGVPHAVAMNSATSALHVACSALGLEPGDWLWTQPNTFVASANCALYCGAQVDFVDIDPERFTICPHRLGAKLAEAEKKGKLPKIVVPVHMCGQPADMDEIGKLAQQYGFSIIEDASHAIGGSYKGQPVGAHPDTAITIFSFHPVKIITSGEGGMAMTRDAELAAKMAILRSHGITRDETLMTHEPDGPWYYQQINLGWNYRMTDIHAALGLSQMTRLDDYIKRRHILAKRYDVALSGFPLRIPTRVDDCISAFHLYSIRLDDADLRRPVFEHLRAADIGVNVHYIPVHLQPYYRRMGFAEGDFPQAEDYYARAISLPLYPALSETEQDFVIATLAEGLGVLDR